MREQRRQETRPLDPEPLWYLKGLAYQHYLQTSHWRIRRAAYLEARKAANPFGLGCDNCGLQHIDEIVVEKSHFVDVWGETCSSRKKNARKVTTREVQRRPPSFHVHHLNYEHLGDEPDEDLRLLCAPCHNAEHYPDSAAAIWWRRTRLERISEERKAAQRPRLRAIDDRDDAWFDEFYGEMSWEAS